MLLRSPAHIWYWLLLLCSPSSGGHPLLPVKSICLAMTLMTFGSVGCSMSQNPWACLSQPRWDSKPSTPPLLNISSCFLTSNSRLSQSPSQLCLEGCTARGEGDVSSSQLVLLERIFSHGQSSFPGEHTALCAEETWDLWTPQSQPAPLECFWDSSNPRLVLNLLRCCCPQFSCPKSQICPFCHSGGNCTLVLQSGNSHDMGSEAGPARGSLKLGKTLWTSGLSHLHLAPAWGTTCLCHWGGSKEGIPVQQPGPRPGCG